MAFIHNTKDINLKAMTQNKRIFYAMYGEFDDLNNPLELKSLQAITDEDAIEIAKITRCVKPSFDRYLNYLLIRDDDDQPYPLGRSGFTYKILFSDQSIELVINGRIGQITNQLAVFDYLRSNCYALPFMGISVEELETAGWIKLVK